jgi:hypothetical protein
LAAAFSKGVMITCQWQDGVTLSDWYNTVLCVTASHMQTLTEAFKESIYMEKLQSTGCWLATTQAAKHWQLAELLKTATAAVPSEASR